MLNTIKNFFDNNAFVGKLKNYYNSIFYPATICLIIFLAHYLKLEVLGASLIILVSSIGIAIEKDLKPFIPLLLNFIFILPLRPEFLGNNTSYTAYVLSNLPIIIILAVLLILSFVIHFILNKGFVEIFTKKTKLSFVFIPLIIFICLNGITNENYEIKNLIFALVNVICWVFIYLLFVHNLTYDENTINFFFKCCFCSAVLLLGELIDTYLTSNVVIDGVINKVNIKLGWGISNNISNILCVIMPAVFYLAYASKKFYKETIFFTVGIISYVAIFFTLCRNGMIFGTIEFIVLVLLLLFKSPNKKQLRIYSIFAFIVILVITMTIYANYKETFENLFGELTQIKLENNGRFKLWKEAFESFKKYPIFGAGFYSTSFETMVSFIPPMYHNTIFELLGCAGITTTICYLFYRAKTIEFILYKLNIEKFFLGVMVLTMVGMSLLDNHLFHIYPTFFYVVALALCELHYTKEKENEKAKLLG